MENKTIGSREYRLTWKNFGYDNLLQMALIAVIEVLLVILLIKGVE